MKKFYLFFVIALLGVLNATAGTYKLHLVIDNPERVTVTHNGTELTNLTTDNELEFVEEAEGSYDHYNNSLMIKAKSNDFFIKSATRANGVEAGSTYVNYEGISQCNISWNDLIANDVITVVTKAYSEVRTSSCTIVVDKAEGVRAQRGNSGIALQLTDGENTVPFDPETEKQFSFESANYGRDLYAVTRNGEPLTASYGTFTVNDMADGDRIEIQYNYPDIDFPVMITVDPALNESQQPFIQSITTDAEGVNTALNSEFTVKAGTRVSINMNTNDYIVDKTTNNGQTVSFYGMTYSFVVTAATNIEITAHAYGKISFIVDIDNPETITLYDDSYYNQRNAIPLVAGSNNVSVSERSGQISFDITSGYYLESFVDEENYSYLNSGYGFQVKEGRVYTVRGGKISLDNKAVIYINDIEKAPYGFGFNNANRDSFTLTSGYNILEFAQSYNPFMLSIYGDGNTTTEMYINGTLTDPMYTGGNSYQLSLNDKDVVKVYINESPEQCAVTISSDATAAYSVITDYFTEVSDPTSFNVFKGTHMAITPVEAGSIIVMKGETMLEADEDGSFQLDIDAATALSITDNAQSGIESVSIATGNADVYNLQGVLILRNAGADDVDKLPAGIYIVGGRKVAVR